MIKAKTKTKPKTKITKTPRQARGKKIVKKKIIKKAVKRARPRARVKPRVVRKKVISKRVVNKTKPSVFLKLLAVILMVSLNSAGLSGLGYTMGYYNDVETSTENAFTASMLDFRLSTSTYNTLIGPEAVGEKTAVTVALPEDVSLPMQYTMSAATSTPTLDPFCNQLTVEAKLNGISIYNGAFPSFASATSTEFGTWEFRFDLPPLASVPHGATCSLDALFSAWRADTATPAESGYTDEERLSFSFTARMVVLNEIFANPGAGVAPKNREYVELYNNGSTPVDTLGWKISEIVGVSTKTFHTVVLSGATPSQMQPYGGASTVITPGGYLVLEFGGTAPHLNNPGDTVSLYDSATTLLDSHAYPSTATGKAHVRFPDGIGFWVDPEPTPGGENAVSLEDLRDAGFDEETINMLLELAALMGVSTTEPEPLELEVPAEVLVEHTEEATTTPEIVSEEPDSTGSPQAAPEEIGGGIVDEPPPEEIATAREEEILPPELTPEEVVPEAIVEEPAEPVVQEEPAVESAPVVEEVVIPEPTVEETVIPEAAPTSEVGAPTESVGVVEPTVEPTPVVSEPAVVPEEPPAVVESAPVEPAPEPEAVVEPTPAIEPAPVVESPPDSTSSPQAAPEPEV